MRYKNIKIQFTYLVLASLFFGFSNSSAQGINDITNRFNQYQQDNFQEKVYVHTDKNYYLAGEMLWFKIYDVNGANNIPVNLTKVAYIELIAPGQTPVLQAKIALKDGSGNGSFYVPFTIASGCYKIRAYTSWMKNFNPAGYFEKGVTIINSLKSPAVQATVKKDPYDVQFFPEGGDLVDGLASKVAFRIVDKHGKGVDCKGVVISDQNDTVAHFSPLKFGLGNFSFTPASGKNYKAFISINGTVISKPLPMAKTNGYVLQVTEAGPNQLKVNITSNVKALTEKVYLLVHNRQDVQYAQENVISDGSTSYIVDKSKLVEGISHITLFNSAKIPVCERLFFKAAVSKLNLQIIPDKKEYDKRKVVMLDVQSKNATGKPLIAELSLAVYRLDSLHQAEDGNIESYLLLTSDLKGNIESPGYYLNNSGQIGEAVDNLMLTQGWSRFNWDNVLKSSKKGFRFLPEYEGHLITGKVTDIQHNVPGSNIMTYLSVPGTRVQFYNSLSDSTGKVIFSTKDIYGFNEVVLQNNLLKDSIYRLEISNPFSNQFSDTQFNKYQVNKDALNTLSLYSLSTQVQNIYSGNKIKKLVNPQVDSSAFYGTSDKSYNLDDYTRFSTMEEVLREYVSEAIVGRQHRKFRIRVPYAAGGFLEDNPLVLLDGVPIFDIDKLMTLDPLKVKKLEVVAQRYYLGPSTNYGVFNFTTYKGDLGGFELDPHAVVVDYEGLQISSDFFSPVYETEMQVNSRMPDYRTLLLWMPSIKINVGNAKAINFYTSDVSGNYIGVIQGITTEGIPGAQTFRFAVK